METDITQTDGLRCDEQTNQKQPLTSCHRKKTKQRRIQRKKLHPLPPAVSCYLTSFPARTHEGADPRMRAHMHARPVTQKKKGKKRKPASRVETEDTGGGRWAVWHFKSSSCYSEEMSYYSARPIYQSQREFPQLWTVKELSLRYPWRVWTIPFSSSFHTNIHTSRK